MRAILHIALLATIFISSCQKNSITNRHQLKLFPESVLQQQGVTAYRDFLNKNTIVRPSNSSDAEMVKRIGSKITAAITDYYRQKGKGKELDGYNWEFNLVSNAQINAWCMPGGKVVVYTGLLPVTQNETALAIVLGHEITHALAHHGNERLSKAMVAQGIQVAGDVYTSNNERNNRIFNSVFMPGAQLGFLLPNSRKNEYEADRYGLIFAAMAGYDPREGVALWQRMAAAGGGKVPEFLATHPSSENRIKRIEKHMDEALIYYKNKQ